MKATFGTVVRRAERQHGRVARRQLLADGVDAKRIDRWLARGLLRRVHRGVYAVGHAAPSVLGDYMAAVLAGGPDAALSHRAAGWLRRLLRGTAPRPEITVATTASRRRPGITIHRSRALDARDVQAVDGIPTTTAARTLVDLAPLLGAEALARACHEAWVHHRCGASEVQACVARNPNRSGVAGLRRALGADVTLSALERAFARLLAEHGLPPARTNVDQRGDKVDCHWPAHGLTVELLSFRYHATRHAFERDVARRRRSQHVAYTYGDVCERPARTAADLRARLAAAGAAA